MKKIFCLAITAFIIFGGLFGSQWGVVNAQGTIPIDIPPFGGNEELIIPVTGGTTISMVSPNVCKDAVLEIPNVARAEFLDCPKPGTEMSMYVLKEEDIAPLASFNYLTEVFQISVDPEFSGRMKLGVFLAESEKQALLQDPEIGLYHFDAVTGEWTRLVAELDGDFLSCETELTGIFVVGKK